MNSAAWAKTPLKMLLILFLAYVLNSGLFVGIQMLYPYTASGPVDEALLSRLDEAWEGCQIQDYKEIQQTNLHVYLIKLPDGSARFVTLLRHYLLDRYRLVKSACQAALDTHDPIWLKAGVTQIEVAVDGTNSYGLMQMKSDSVAFPQHARKQFLTHTLLFSTGLGILELAAWCLLFRKEEVA